MTVVVAVVVAVVMDVLEGVLVAMFVTVVVIAFVTVVKSMIAGPVVVASEVRMIMDVSASFVRSDHYK